MPPGRAAAKSRLVSNENDENAVTTRMTRAKAAALNVDELSQPSKSLPSKKAASNTTAQAGTRKRAALGDVSNYGKVEAAETKKTGSKIGLVSKAAQPTGIQKKTTATTGRTALASKELNKKIETKRSGPGSIGAFQKRKVPSTASSIITVKEESALVDDGEPVRKKVHTAELEKKAIVEPLQEEVVGKLAAQKAEHDPELEPAASEPAEPGTCELPPGVKDLDFDDLDDPLMVSEYAGEIFEYLRDLECKSVPNPRYMDHQDDLEWKTRGILIDWLIEVHTRFHLLPETLFLTVNIIDRFLSEKVVQLDRLQLVGVTAMFIASKYEEVLSPHVANFKHVADDGFTEAEILSAERFVLSTLNYDLSYPNPMNFLRRISKAENYDIQCRTMGKYLLEIMLLDHRFMAYRPSHVAAAAMYLARLILDRGPWDETLAYYSGYTEEEIDPVAALMVDYLARPITHEAFFKKYASKRFMKASLMTRQWARKNADLYDVEDAHVPLDQLE